MNWIKKNPAQFALAVVAVALLGSAYLLYADYSKFPEVFEESQRTPSPNKEVPALDMAGIEAAKEAVAAPDVWTPSKSRLFAGKPVATPGYRR